MYVCKDLLNLDCKDSIRFDTYKMKRHLEDFLLPIFCKMF